MLFFLTFFFFFFWWSQWKQILLSASLTSLPHHTSVCLFPVDNIYHRFRTAVSTCEKLFTVSSTVFQGLSAGCLDPSSAAWPQPRCSICCQHLTPPTICCSLTQFTYRQLASHNLGFPAFRRLVCVEVLKCLPACVYTNLDWCGYQYYASVCFVSLVTFLTGKICFLVVVVFGFSWVSSSIFRPSFYNLSPFSLSLFFPLFFFSFFFFFFFFFVISFLKNDF